MIYMFKKAGSYEKARKTFALMAERGIEQSTVTYNSLMSFETNYKEVSNIYDQVFACLSHTTLLSEVWTSLLLQHHIIFIISKWGRNWFWLTCVTKMVLSYSAWTVTRLGTSIKL